MLGLTSADDSYWVRWTCLLETRDARAMQRVAGRIGKLLGVAESLPIHPSYAARGLVCVGYRFDGPLALCVFDALVRCSKLSKATWALDPGRLSASEFYAWTASRFRTAGMMEAHLEIQPAAYFMDMPETSVITPN